MAEKKPAENDAPEEPDFEAGLTSEQIMNMNFVTKEDYEEQFGEHPKEGEKQKPAAKGEKKA